MGFVIKPIIHLNAICACDVSLKNLFFVVFYFVMPNGVSAFASSSNLSSSPNSSFIFDSTNKDINYYNYVNSVEGFTVNYSNNWHVGFFNQVTLET
jgi:hypothetical protein